MERFLERMSLSEYKDKLILKGGLLVASMVGIDNHATVDLDAEDARKMIEEIISVSLQDEVQFTIRSVESIMDEAEYPGIRLKLETVLAEKMKTVISRGILNTRMRDYYDLTVLNIVKSESINVSDLKKALEATSRKRGSHELMADWEHILKQIREDIGLMGQWERYQRKYN